jgi:hypothetical protein
MNDGVGWLVRSGNLTTGSDRSSALPAATATAARRAAVALCGLGTAIIVPALTVGTGRALVLPGTGPGLSRTCALRSGRVGEFRRIA